MEKQELDEFKEYFLTRVVVSKGSSLYEPHSYLGNSGLIKKETRMWLYENVGVGVDSLHTLYESRSAQWAYVGPKIDTIEWDRIRWSRSPEFLPFDVEFYFYDRAKAFEFKLTWA